MSQPAGSPQAEMFTFDLKVAEVLKLNAKATAKTVVIVRETETDDQEYVGLL